MNYYLRFLNFEIYSIKLSRGYIFSERVSKKRKKKKNWNETLGTTPGRKLLVCKITSYRCIKKRGEQRAGIGRGDDFSSFSRIRGRKGGRARLPGRKGEQIPQVVDFTGLKINPHNYPIPFFSAGPPLVSAFYTVACTSRAFCGVPWRGGSRAG